MTIVIYNEYKLEQLRDVARIDINHTHDVIKAEKGDLAEILLNNNTKVYICTNRIRRIYDEMKPYHTRKTEAVNITNTMI